MATPGKLLNANSNTQVCSSTTYTMFEKLIEEQEPVESILFATGRRNSPKNGHLPLTTDGHKARTSLYCLDASTSSATNMRLVSFWLQSCLKNHMPCRTWADNTVPPTRLMNIEDPMRPLLQDPPYKHGGYVALSYKWGNSKRYLSLVLNVQSHYQMIPVDLLPKTFTDAIYIAHQLGFLYLWIDALCIIQDSSDDREGEIGRMGDIFRASTLTLFAQAGDDADAGLSVIRDPRRIKPCKLTVRATLMDRCIIETIYAAMDLSFQEGDHPLQKRGWVLQEEVLSSRALYFGHEQLEWRCHCSTVQETLSYPGKSDISHVHSPQTDEDWRDVYKCYNDSKAYSGLRELLRIQATDSWLTVENTTVKAWYECIENYSRRDLTYASDVLPALAGIATILSSTQKAQYVNGLWEKGLTFGLLWFVESLSIACTASESDHTDSQATIVETTVIPSWTWVSRWGRSIKFFVAHYRYPLSLASVHLNYDHEQDSDEKGHFSRFQNISTRELFLTGYTVTVLVDLEPGKCEQPPYDILLEKAWLRIVISPKTQAPIGYVALDEDPMKASVHEITGLLCAVLRLIRSPDLLVSLALVRVGRDQYARVGLIFEDVSNETANELMEQVDNPKNDLCEGRRKETICLV
jgi:hypothetical protein